MPAPLLPDLSATHAIVTGANAGIGRATAEALAGAGARVWLACRTRDKAEPALAAIAAAGGRADFLALDLGELASVRAAADAFLATGEPLHLLVNNAGVGGQRGQTRDGFELHFGVNHLGHYLLTRLLLPRLEAAAPARIVNVSSASHYQARGIDWEAVRLRTPSLAGMREYTVSKLANVLFTRELARRLAGTGVTTYAVHPGVIASEIWRRVPGLRTAMRLVAKSPAEGAWTTLACATAPELAGASGAYYHDQQERRPSRAAQDDALAAELWRRSAEWTGLPD
jgi:retinol dehydrogenase 12